MRYGVYKGKVIDSSDTENRGRLLVKIPTLGFNWVKWAEPCVPFTQFMIPSTGILVWVMFENGDENKPVWIGKMWLASENPATKAIKGAARSSDTVKVSIKADDIIGYTSDMKVVKASKTGAMGGGDVEVSGTIIGGSSKIKIED